MTPRWISLIVAGMWTEASAAGASGGPFCTRAPVSVAHQAPLGAHESQMARRTRTREYGFRRDTLGHDVYRRARGALWRIS